MNKHWAGQYDAAIEFIQKLCGISLDESKEYLINSRFEKLVHQFKSGSLAHLVEMAKAPPGEPIRRAIIEAITIRETQFFRDPAVFDALRYVAIPEVIKNKRKEGSNKIRIWSAASSSGQESCSIAMTLLEAVPEIGKWDIEIIGTDISSDAVAKAKKGLYSKLEVERGLPAWFLRTYMRPQGDGYKVSENVSKMLQFRELNLLHTFPFKEPFDIIFCRNVAIYFEKKVKLQLFRRFLPIMQPYGYLFVGVSESLLDCGSEFKPISSNKATYYQPNQATNLKSPLPHSETYTSPGNFRSDPSPESRGNVANRINLTPEVHSGVVRYEPAANQKPQKP